ncbi:MAG: dienelactone hydrolase family protein [Acidobacteriota bacterium]|nr:dienelactone hydrolase family protein [Acidobacteriota bacterium]MDQ5872352.1 dienelactone hydrolase family protein [Acidobacteriota bacterium]
MTDSGAASLLAVCVLASGCAAATTPSAPAAGRQTERSAAGTRYLLHLPPAHENESAWPLILFLHGGGERGEDLSLVRREGLPRILENVPDFPFVVVSPQETVARRWTPDSLVNLLDEAAAKHRADPARVYATGLSSGAVSALELAAAHPERIAAVAVVSPNRLPPDVCRLKEVPVWIFHNSGDTRIPAGRIRRFERTLRACGGDVRVTIYDRARHDAWTETYDRRDLYEWFLKHRVRRAAS